MTQNVLDYEMHLISAEWADFQMERAYWTALADIAKVKDVTPARLVTVIKMCFPGVPTEDAVRLSIINHFRMQFGGFSATTDKSVGHEDESVNAHVTMPHSMENRNRTVSRRQASSRLNPLEFQE